MFSHPRLSGARSVGSSTRAVARRGAARTKSSQLPVPGKAVLYLFQQPGLPTSSEAVCARVARRLTQ
jgi:hypothetical protein